MPTKPRTDDFVDIPSEFWKRLGEEGFARVCERGYLDAEQCAQLWRMTDRQDQPPERLEVWVEKRGVDKVIEEALAKAKRRAIDKVLRRS